MNKLVDIFEEVDSTISKLDIKPSKDALKVAASLSKDKTPPKEVQRVMKSVPIESKQHKIARKIDFRLNEAGDERPTRRSTNVRPGHMRKNGEDFRISSADKTGRRNAYGPSGKFGTFADTKVGDMKPAFRDEVGEPEDNIYDGGAAPRKRFFPPKISGFEVVWEDHTGALETSQFEFGGTPGSEAAESEIEEAEQNAREFASELAGAGYIVKKYQDGIDRTKTNPYRYLHAQS